MAQLGTVGFNSFEELNDGLSAYILKEDHREDILDNIQILSTSEFDISYSIEEIEQVNWNEEWEKNFDPIIVDGSCIVRAPFHEKTDLPFEIIIEPKMSFGTGHHETTHMMIQHILENEFKGKAVLDMGCGTAVLAILASMRGAKTVDAIDIDTWCVENSEENISRNNIDNIKVALGDAQILEKSKYDTVIANINRNILLEDLAVYSASLKGKGEIYLSGFYSEDLQIITTTCNNLGFSIVEKKERNNWIAAKFVN